VSFLKRLFIQILRTFFGYVAQNPPFSQSLQKSRGNVCSNFIRRSSHFNPLPFLKYALTSFINCPPQTQKLQRVFALPLHFLQRTLPQNCKFFSKTGFLSCNAADLPSFSKAKPHRSGARDQRI